MLSKKAEPNPNGYVFLNVGTKILAKDLMDQYIRSLGQHRTHYALTAESAKRLLKAGPIDVLILENQLEDSTAYRFVRELRESAEGQNVYIIFAMEEASEALNHLADELEIEGRLVKPFTAKDLQREYERFEHFRTVKNPLEQLIKDAKLAFKEKRYQKADELYKTLAEKSGPDPKALTALGVHCFQKADFPKAEEYLNKVLELRPHHVPALYAYGQLALRKKDFKLAYEKLSKAHELSPLNADRALELAQLHLKWATEHLSVASREDSKNSDLHFELARLLILQRDASRGVHELKEANLLQSHPKYKEGQALLQFLAGKTS